MTSIDPHRRQTPHPLDPDPADSAAVPASSSVEPHPVTRFPRIETGRSFPLSFLVFLSTVASIFFALWRVSTEGAIGTLCLLSPGFIYTMWVVEQRRLNGEGISFAEQAYLWLRSTTILTSCLFVFAVTFALAYAVTILSFYFVAKYLLGGNTETDAVVMGSIVALPIACYGSIFAVYGLIRLVWGRHWADPVDVRN